MSLHKIIKESIDDFDWIKDIESSIDIDNLSGYYFTWEDDHLNRKFYIKDYIGEFEVQIHWVHDGEDLYNTLDKVRLLSHIKNGNYKLYDKNEEPVNPDKFSRDLANGVNKLINDKALRDKMAKNGRKRVEDFFDWKAIAKQTVDIYKSLI